VRAVQSFLVAGSYLSSPTQKFGLLPNLERQRTKPVSDLYREFLMPIPIIYRHKTY
jgi:hypothetical protein